MDLMELGKTPINEANPAGDDVKYEPEMEALQVEIDKMASATAGGTGIDWHRVVNLAQTILGEKSKNIQVASYLGAGLIQTMGIEGFGIGLTVLKDLTENFWETMYPPLKRKRGRFNAITWWADRADAFLAGFEPAPLPEEQVEALRQGLSGLDEALASKDDEAPMVARQLLAYVNRLPVQPKEAPPSAAPPAAEAAAPTAVAAAGPSPVEDLQSEQDADQLLDFTLGRLAKVADYYLEKHPANPLGYRLTRIAFWLPVADAPPAEGGRTLIPPPNEAIREAWNGLWAAQDYESLLQGTEAQVREYLFWLDPSRITAQALEQLGRKYEAAAEAVAIETALYIKRVPGMAKLSFSDGTPFADAETRAWLKSIASTEDGGGEGAAAGDGGVDAEIQAAVNEARNLMKDAKRTEAVKLLENGMMHGGSGRLKLMWRMALTGLLQNSGMGDLARPHYKAMLDQVDAYRIEEWDPPLALKCLTTIYEGLIIENDEESVTEARKCLDRISRISPAEAMNILK